MVKLDKRLAACAALVRSGKSVADIGTDHALVPCWLWKNGVSTDIIAADIKPGPLESARRTVQKYGADVKLVLSDGFGKLPPRDDVIIAGMGGETIAEILGGCKHKNADTRFILQPMTRQEILRNELVRMNFEIIEEISAACTKKTYTIIYARYIGENYESS
ncbi:MAG: class I SAM-dependent methyltransferase [Oscillospiraceae bacterium]|nr:class I SAM-dependent methyltransferase [Oscillospiraceae bacterium]